MSNKIYVCNAFSPSMLNRDVQRLEVGNPFHPVRILHPIDEPKEWLDAWIGKAEIVSAIGHESTAALFSEALGMSLGTNRVSIKLDDYTIALVGQYIGPRLPEGATELPEGARIEWWVV